ncbi:unnamed protein product [Calypogeia fissa]
MEEEMRHGSLKGPPNLAPLQVTSSYSNQTGVAMDPPHSEHNGNPNPNTGPLISTRSEKFMAERVKEMSQMDSPELRELAFKMGNMLKIQTPKYQSESASSPSHLTVDVASRWQILQGCNDWRGMLDPLDHALRAEIIRYGEFAQATYDAFEATCKYEKETLLESVGLGNRGYEITQYIYGTTNLHLLNMLSLKKSQSSSTSSRESSVGSGSGSGHHHDAEHRSKQSNWIGFVAVCTSPEEIAWRGTQTPNEMIADITDYMSPAGFGPANDSHVRVQAGFHSVYTSTNPASQFNKTTSARDQVLGAVKTFVEKYKHEGKLSITVTGHSLGSALATLCAYDIAESKYNLLSDSPSAPQKWSLETSRKPQEDSPVKHSHFESVKTMIHSAVHHHDKEGSNGRNEDMLVKHPHTASVRNFLHSKLHHEEAHRQKIVKDVKTFVGNEVKEFPQGTIPVTVFSFAGPRVGNRVFRDRLQDLGVVVLRVVNVHDLVPTLPGLKQFSLVAEKLHKLIPHLPSYKHAGVKLEVDNTKSLYLKVPATIMQAHSMEAYLHLVDVYRSRHHYAGAHDKTFRDYALVNRTSDFLKHEYYIPHSWKNSKEVARDAEGKWVIPGRADWTVPKAPNVEEEYADFWQKVDDAAARSHPAPPNYRL